MQRTEKHVRANAHMLRMNAQCLWVSLCVYLWGCVFTECMSCTPFCCAGALKAPQTPGKTQVLPSRVRPPCPHVHENHAFVNFVSYSYETEAS